MQHFVMQHKAHHFPRFPSPSCFPRPNQAKSMRLGDVEVFRVWEQQDCNGTDMDVFKNLIVPKRHADSYEQRW